MKSFNYKDAVIYSLVENTIQITFPNENISTISGENIVSESMTLKQSISDSDELRFGGCIASEFRINLMNSQNRVFSESLKGKWISVSITQTYPEELWLPGKPYPSNERFPGYRNGNRVFWIFSGCIDEVKIGGTNSNVISIVAYDAFAKLYEIDATDKLRELWTSSSSANKTLYRLISACLEQVPTQEDSLNMNTFLNETYTDSGNQIALRNHICVNEDWLLNAKKVSYGELLRCACEILGLFGIIRPESYQGGDFILVQLSQTVDETYSFFEELDEQNFDCTGYTDIQFNTGGEKFEKKPISILLNSAQDASGTKQLYSLSDNILAWEKGFNSGGALINHEFESLVNLTTVEKRFFMSGSSGNQLTYVPLTAKLDGRLWVELGDCVEIEIKKIDPNGEYVYENNEIQVRTIKTFVLNRTITGIQALTDNIEIKGVA